MNTTTRFAAWIAFGPEYTGYRDLTITSETGPADDLSVVTDSDDQVHHQSLEHLDWGDDGDAPDDLYKQADAILADWGFERDGDWADSGATLAATVQPIQQ